MSDTPETDAKACRTAFSDGFHSVESCPADKGSWVDIDFARKLERERNEARARGDTYGQKYAACILEREKLKAELKQMSMCLDASNDARSMIGNERDQLRKVADELAMHLNIHQETCPGPVDSFDASGAALNNYNSLPHVIERNKSK